MLSIGFAAAPAAATHDEYACAGEETGAGDICVIQSETGDDPECPDSGDSYYARNGVRADVASPTGHDVDASAEGGESCYNSSFSNYQSSSSFIRADADVCEGWDCQGAHVTWYQSESSYGTYCYTYVYYHTEAGYDFVYLEDVTGEECSAGAPPNPGWGAVLP